MGRKRIINTALIFLIILIMQSIAVLSDSNCTVNWLDSLDYQKPACVDIVMHNNCTYSYYINLDSGTNGAGTSGSPFNSFGSLSGKAGMSGGPACVYVRGSGEFQRYLDSGVGNFYGSPGNEIIIRPWTGYTASLTYNYITSTTSRFQNIIWDGGDDLGFHFISGPDTYNGAWDFKYEGNNDYLANWTFYRTQWSCGTGDGQLFSAIGRSVNINFINNEFYDCDNGNNVNGHQFYMSAATNSGSWPNDCTGGQLCACINYTFKNNIFRDNNNGIEVNIRDSSAPYQIDGLTIEGNAFHNIGKGLCGTSWECRPAITLSETSSGSPQWRNVLIKNNLIWDTASGAIWTRAGNAGIYHNTITTWGVGAGSAFNQAIGGAGYPNSAIVKNNIIYDGTKDPFDSGPFTATNNLCGSGESCGTSSRVYSANTFLSTDENNPNFLKIGENSEAIDKAINANVTNDYSDITRSLDGNHNGTSEPDIGAFEYEYVPTVNWLDPLNYTKPKGVSVMMPDESTVTNKYYVDMTSGSGTTCSFANPCGSVSAVAGKPGTTGGPAYIYLKGTGNIALYGTLYGSTGNEIVIKPWPNATGEVTLNGPNNFESANVHHLILDGGPNLSFVFEGASGYSEGNSNGFAVNVNSNYLTFYRVKISVEGGTEGVGISRNGGAVTGSTFINCEMYDNNPSSGAPLMYPGGGNLCSGSSIIDNTTIKNCIFRSAGPQAIEFNPRTRADGVLIEGNAFHDFGYLTCGTSWQCRPPIIIDGPSCGGYTTNVIIRNNIMWDSGSGCVWDRGGTSNIWIYNNVCYDYGAGSGGGGPNPQGVSGYSNGGSATIKNNIFYSTTGVNPLDGSSFVRTYNLCGLGESCATTGQQTDSAVNIFISTDENNPNFLKLKNGSKAIDNGTNVGVLTDYLGNSRPYGSGYDIGAFEYLSGVASDSTAPTVSLIGPSNYNVSKNLTINFSCSASDASNLFNISLFANFSGGFVLNESRSASGTSASVNFSKTLSTGNYRWGCNACDEYDNCGFASSDYYLTIDNTGPVVSLESPNNNSVWNTSRSVAFRFNVSDSSNISSCGLYINNVLNSTDSTITKGVSQNISVNLSNVLYDWSINCTDAAGNVGGSYLYNVSVNVANQPPSVSLTTPGSGSSDSDGNLSLVCSAIDDVELKNISLYHNVSGSFVYNQTVNIGGLSNSTTFYLNNLNNGSYRWNCYACDNGSQCSFAAANYSFIVSTGGNAPLVSLLSPDNGQGGLTSNVNLVCSATDNGYLYNLSLYTDVSGVFSRTAFYDAREAQSDSSTLFLYHLNKDSSYGESDSLYYDFSSNKNNISCASNCPTYTASGKISGAYTFDGSADYLQLTDKTYLTLDTAKDYSWSFWIKPTNLAGEWENVFGEFASTTNYLSFYAHTTTDANWGAVTNGISAGWTFNDPTNALVVHSNNNVLTNNMFYNVVIVYNHTPAQNLRMKIFVNGADVTNADIFSQGAISSVNPSTIRIGGNDVWGVAERFTGTIDEAVMYNKTLTALEIASLYNMTKNNYQINYSLSGIANGTYSWNCLAYDNDSTFSWGGTNYSFTVGSTSNISTVSSTLNSPSDVSMDDDGNITFSCNATAVNSKLTNISLYTNYSVWHMNQTNIVGGASNTTNFTLNNLPNGAVIRWNCYACNNMTNCSYASNNYSVSVVFDLTPPSIGNVSNSSITNQSVIIGWQTNEPANTTVLYGTAIGALGNVSGNITLALNHVISLNDLLPNTTYYYNVSSCDSYRNCNMTGIYDFNTSANQVSDNASPTIMLDAPVNALVSSNATVVFNCSASDDVKLSNISLFGNWSSGWHLNQTSDVGGLSNSTVFTKTLGDGDYKWNCYACDNSSNCGFAANNYSFAVNTSVPDTTAPSIVLNSPLNNSQFNNTVSVVFNFSASDNNKTLLNCSLYVNNVLNQTNTSVLNGSLSYFTINNFRLGSYSWDVNCSDGSNSNVSGFRNFTIADTINPSIGFGGGLAVNGVYASNNFIYVNVSANDSYESNITFYLYNSTGLRNSSVKAAGVRSLNFTNLADGVYFYNVTVYDTSGNRNSTSTYNVSLDTTNPVISYGVGTESNNSYFNRTYIFVNVSLTEINFKNITFNLYNSSVLINRTTFNDSTRSINFTNLPINGRYFYNITVYDLAGNFEVLETWRLTLDGLSPFVNITHPPNATNTTDPTPLLMINLSDNLGERINYSVFVDNVFSGQYGFFDVGLSNLSLIPLDLGNRSVIVQVTDEAGNSFNSSILSVTVMPYAIYLMSPSDDYYTNQTDLTFIFNVSDPDSATLNCSLFINGLKNQTNETVKNYTQTGFAAINLSEGNNQEWLISCVNENDVVGNNSNHFNIDLSDPSINFSQDTPLDGVLYNKDWLVVNVSAYDLNEENITFSISGSLGYSNTSVFSAGVRSINFTGLVDDIYYYNVSVNDKVSHSTTIARWLIVDATVPSFDSSDTNFADGKEYDPAFDYGFNTTVSDSHLASVWFSDNFSGGLTNRTVIFSGGVYGYNFLGLNVGGYEYTWYANDTAGNINSETYHFSIGADTTSPSVVIISPQNTNYTSTNISLEFLGYDDNIDACWYADSGGVNVSLVGCSNSSFIAQQGINSITFFVNDSFMNLNSSSVEFFVDSISPNLTNYSLSISNNIVQISINSSEIANITISYGVNPSFDSNSDDIVFDLNHSMVLSHLFAGISYYFNITLFDVYGNGEVFGTYNFTTQNHPDTTPPIISIMNPAEGHSLTTSSTITFEYNVSDDNTVSNCSLFIDDVLRSSDDTITNDVVQSFSLSLANAAYDWFINCSDTSNNSEVSERRNLTVSYTVSNPNAPGSSGGGGGGAGGGGTIYLVNDTEIKEGYTQTLTSGSILKINLTNTWYWVTLSGFTTNTATIKADSQISMIGLNEELVTDKNVSIKLLSTTNHNATLKVKLYSSSNIQTNMPSIISNKNNATLIIEKPMQTDNNPDTGDNDRKTNSDMSIKNQDSGLFDLLLSIGIWLIAFIAIGVIVTMFLMIKKSKILTQKLGENNQPNKDGQKTNPQSLEDKYSQAMHQVDDYITKERQLGLSDEQIEQNLEKVGWKHEIVENELKK